MDKIMGLFAVVGLGIIAGSFTLFLGWLMDDDRTNKRKSNIDNDIRIYIPRRNRGGRGNNGPDKQNEVKVDEKGS